MTAVSIKDQVRWMVLNDPKLMEFVKRLHELPEPEHASNAHTEVV